MPGIPTRLERLERATAEVRRVWLYAGWSGRPGIEGAGDGVYRVFVPTLPPALFAVPRHPGGAEVSAAAAAWALAQLAPRPRQRALSGAARSLVLITAGDSEPPPEAEADGATPPEAEAGPPPAAEEPPLPAATPPPAATPWWPEWPPR
jgi:hypothetical protein